MSKRNSSGSHRYWNRLIRDHTQAGKDRTKSKHLSPLYQNERAGPQAYMLTTEKTPYIACECFVCRKVSIYPENKSDGRRCPHCGNHGAAIGYAKKVGEACADETI